MKIAKVSSKGQVIIPIEIRKKLNLKEGDKVLFIEEGDRVILLNAGYVAIKEIQETMKQEAENSGLKTEEEITEFVKKLREEIWKNRYEDNA
jgi:AbrB family looped-hinge helix DNA binding protein